MVPLTYSPLWSDCIKIVIDSHSPGKTFQSAIGFSYLNHYLQHKFNISVHFPSIQAERVLRFLKDPYESLW